MATLTIEQEENLTQLLGETDDFGEDLRTALKSVGDTFGLHDVMLNNGPISSACLATQAGIPERLVRRWLNIQAAGNCLGHHVSTDLYGLWCALPANADKVS